MVTLFVVRNSVIECCTDLSDFDDPSADEELEVLAFDQRGGKRSLSLSETSLKMAG